MTSRLALGDYIPWPFVGVTVLLVVFILVTPVLLSIGGAPGITTEAELIVDRVVGEPTYHLYVRALGATDRYAEIRLGIANDFGWDGTHGVAWSDLVWSNWTNDSDVLELDLMTPFNPVAVNVSALYSGSGGSALYVGTFAFFVSGTVAAGETLFAASSTPGVAVPSSTAVSNSTLPLTILLVSSGTGGI